MLNDRATLELYRQGDTEVMAAVFHHYAPDVARIARYGFAFRSQGKPCSFRGFYDVQEQENLIQEAFARAFAPQARARYDGLVPYDAYLKRIAKNIVIDGLRRSGTQKLAAVDLDDLEHTESVIDDEIPADQQLHRKQLALAVQTFLAGLEGSERRFIELRYQQGMSQQEVADALGQGRRVVRTTESRLRSALHKALRTAGLIDPFKRSWRGLELMSTLQSMGLLA